MRKYVYCYTRNDVNKLVKKINLNRCLNKTLSQKFVHYEIIDAL